MNQETDTLTRSEPIADHTDSAIAKAIIHSLENDKAQELCLIDLRHQTSFADLMIIADGRSTRHVGSMADKLATTLKHIGAPLLGIEGTENCDWVLIDAGDVIIHLFKPGIRELYHLEKMWSAPMPDSPVTHI